MSLIFHGFAAMIELLCPLSPPLIDAEHMITPLLSLLTELPHFSPVRYDLNQHESWRAFDPEKTCVDALSQRVQLLRVQGKDPSHLAMLSLGKLGEQPAFVVRAPEADVDEVRDVLAHHVDAIPMRWLTITSSAWKEALPDASVPPLSPLMVWPVEKVRHDTPPLITHRTLEHTIIWQLSSSFEPPSQDLLASLREHTT